MMFSYNGKISEKQLRRMVVLPVFASVIFVLPYLAARLFGASIVPGLLVFFVFAGVYVLYIYGMGEWFERSRKGTGKEGYISVLSEAGIIGKTLSLVQLARLVVRLAFYILLAIAILEDAQVPFMVKTPDEIYSDVLVVLPLLLVGIYGANVQVEKQGRIQEVLFWLLFVPFLVMMLFGLKEVDYSVFVPKVDKSFGSLLLYGYMLLVFVLPVENYLYLRPALRQHKERNTSYLAVIISVVLAILITLFIIGIYGLRGAADNPLTIIDIMRYIQLPFGVLERFDVLMIWFFMIGCFVLICGTLYFAKHIFCSICKNASSVWVLFGLLALALLIVVYVRDYNNALLTFICYGAMMDVPFSIVLPLLGIGINRFYEADSEEE